MAVFTKYVVHPPQFSSFTVHSAGVYCLHTQSCLYTVKYSWIIHTFSSFTGSFSSDFIHTSTTPAYKVKPPVVVSFISCFSQWCRLRLFLPSWSQDVTSFHGSIKALATPGRGSNQWGYTYALTASRRMIWYKAGIDPSHLPSYWLFSYFWSFGFKLKLINSVNKQSPQKWKRKSFPGPDVHVISTAVDHVTQGILSMSSPQTKSNSFVLIHHPSRL